MFLTPLFLGCHVAPLSSLRNTPAALIATHMRWSALGSRTIECTINPPLPGVHLSRDSCSLRALFSCQLTPPSPLTNSDAGSTPQYTRPGCDSRPGAIRQPLATLLPESSGNFGAASPNV